ncbi:hypothetical protein [Variovorax paradoxus]|nr:hypothetical protein [Variovorax paradoxus]
MPVLVESPSVNAFSYLSLCLLGRVPAPPAFPTVGMAVSRYTPWSDGE